MLQVFQASLLSTKCRSRLMTLNVTESIRRIKLYTLPVNPNLRGSQAPCRGSTEASPMHAAPWEVRAPMQAPELGVGVTSPKPLHAQGHGAKGRERVLHWATTQTAFQKSWIPRPYGGGRWVAEGTDLRVWRCLPACVTLRRIHHISGPFFSHP